MQSNSPATALKTLKIIHFAIMGGPLLFATFTVFNLLSSDETQLIDTTNPLSYFPLLMAIVVIPVSNYMFSSTLKKGLEGQTELGMKLGSFQTAHIIKMALLEGCTLFALVGSFTTYTVANFGVFVVMFALMILSTPSAFKLVETLNLTPEEIRLLRDL